jgi:hypothetical protein
LEYESRYAEGQPDRFPALAADLVRLNVNVIVTVGLFATKAAMAATTTIPIVLIGVSHPVEGGRRAMERDASAYLERLLDVNSARIPNDFRECVLQSCRELEAGLRRRLRRRPASDAPVPPPVPRTSSRRTYRDLSRPPCDA